jgi:hypothetical protein
MSGFTVCPERKPTPVVGIEVKDITVLAEERKDNMGYDDHQDI